MLCLTSNKVSIIALSSLWSMLRFGVAFYPLSGTDDVLAAWISVLSFAATLFELIF